MLFLPLALLALSRHGGITWLIDGSNLLGHRGTPKDPNVIAQKLEPIQQQAENVVLVFDGKKGESSSGSTTATRIEELGRGFHQISLGLGLSADEYIEQEIQRIQEANPRARIQVVTADRELRRKVRIHSAGVVNPLTFWRRYLPRLSGMKGRSGEVEVEDGNAQ